MKCPKCHHENPEDSSFCNKCGNKITDSPMPPPQPISLDEKIEKIQCYLPNGLTEKILAQRGKIEGERKQVTVMFCDMEGFTPLVEKLGSEKAYSVMDEVYEILIHKVHDFEGTVNEMTGDGIMALFGAPIALEDAPQRALRSALAIHKGINNFNGNRKGIDPIKIRIGVHSGPVVVGTLGNDLRVEFKAVGDTVNLASRMEGLAEPGTTYTTETTFKLTEGIFSFEHMGEKEVKGKESSVPVYKLLSVKKDIHRPRLGLERSIYSEMVGRDKELDRLELQVLKAINGEGSIVNIIGEAGIGKSRLVAELKNREVVKRVSLFEGRAISTGRNLSFHPIIDLLKHFTKIGEDDSGAKALNKLEITIRKVAPEDLDEILPFVATLMGMKLSGRYADRVKGIEGEALEKLILKNMRDLLIKATEQNPLVIVIEDLHWADNSSIELLESLFRLSETQPIVFINVFRPGHEETGDRMVENIKERYPTQYVEIAVQPLDEKMSETLINNMLEIKGLKHSVIDQIIERADGNPFFIEEVVRSFIDQGAVIQKDGTFEVTDKIENMVIPHTINDVLMARIDQLDEKTRELVKIASVIGRNFFYRILKEMTKTIDDIDTRLSYLQEIQLFRERKRMEEIEYLFKHALAQEAAYESILSDIRRELHLKVANSIEKVFSNRLHEFYGMLAYHYSKGENLDKTEEYMLKAGEAALSSSASSEALRYYQETLDLYLNTYGKNADPEKLAMVEKNIALALSYIGELEDSIIYFNRVFKRWGIKTPKNAIFILIKFLLDLFKVILHLYFPILKSKKVPTNKDNEFFDLSYTYNRALVNINAMKNITEQIGAIKKLLDFDLRKVRNWYYTFFAGSTIFCISGLSFSLSKKFLEYGEGFIDKNDFRELFALNFFTLIHNVYSGNVDNITDYDEGLLDKNSKIGQFVEVALYLYTYVFIKTFQGDFQTIDRVNDIISEIVDSYGLEAFRIFLPSILTSCSLKCRKFYDAQKWVKEYELSVVKTDFELYLLECFGLKAQIQILSEDLDGARESLIKADEVIQKQRLTSPWFAGTYFIAEFSFNIRLLKESIISNNKLEISKRRDDAYKSGKKALRNGKKNPYSRPEVFRLMGTYYWIIGKQVKSGKWWKRSIKEGERLGGRPDLARTYMEIGKRFMEEKSKYKELNGISATEYLEKARELFQEMDLQWDLDELDKIDLAGSLARI